MYSEQDLSDAVTDGIISADTADALRTYVASRRASPMVDEEPARLITGFNDIFVVIASSLLLLAASWLGSVIAKGVGGLVLAVIAWALAEFFTRKQKMALPSIVLTLAFIGGCVVACQELLPLPDGITSIASGVVGACAAWVHWRRFQVPIAIATGCAALLFSAFLLVVTQIPYTQKWLALLFFLCGVVMFMLALFWDASDPNRRTRRSDVAFWLHLLSAPLLVHPVFILFGTQNSLIIIGLYLVITLISIAIDRRALMVAALGYALYAFTSLLSLSGVVSLNFAFTALILGSSLLLLSAFWQPCRRWVLRPLPETLRRRLAPLR